MSLPNPLPPFVYIHRACGYPAFYLKRRPERCAPLRSKDALHLDGTPIAPFAPCFCDSCGKLVDRPQTAHIFAVAPS